MKYARILLMVALSVGTAFAAEAKTVKLGKLVSADNPTPFGYGGDGKGKFDDFLKFTLTGLSDLSGSIFSSKINNFAVSLEEKGGLGWSTLGSVSTPSFSFADLSSGKYRFEITGKGTARNTLWNGSLNVTSVPEADTWVMMLVGAGLVGFQLRRKQQSLPRSSITAS